MKKKLMFIILSVSMSSIIHAQVNETLKWHKYEISFTSSNSYENPVQQVRIFEVNFMSPTGIIKTVNGFWDGGTLWKVRSTG